MKRQIHGRNITVAEHDTVVCQKKFVTVVKEGADVELCIENIGPITNHRARARACGAACVSEVDCNALALPPLSRGSQQETIALLS